MYLTPEEVWERAQIGETVGPIIWEIPREEQEALLDALDNDHPWYRRCSPFGPPVFFPVFLQALYHQLLETRFAWSFPVAAKMEIETLQPCRVDSRFTGRMRVADKQERRGGRYLVTETIVADEAGTIVLRIRNTTLVNAAALYQRGVRR